MRTVLRIALFGALLLLGTGLASPGTARADDVSATVDVSLFYEPLAAHGSWVRVEPYGWGWSPTVTDYAWQPYRYGHWAWTDLYGWVWVSDEPFGWATYHYGRWLYADDYGWVWLPGTVWAPAWVEWRSSDKWVG